MNYCDENNVKSKPFTCTFNFFYIIIYKMNFYKQNKYIMLISIIEKFK